MLTDDLRQCASYATAHKPLTEDRTECIITRRVGIRR
jgi:hypothetical protein